ncbi:phage tail tube protein [Agrobacterium vitis]|uniref:phage tail tube protein n=1 Tax=Agrobacterium vitis TaxID=373 RepID=UPI001576D899|nr:phage tail tube protein [Agrobacterium vitis]
MTKYARNKALLVKPETVYGTDVVPTGAANAIQASNFNFEPLLGTDVSRDLILPYMGHQGVILTGNYARVGFDVEVAGSGAAGTAPAWGVPMRACGMAEVITAGADVKYTPISGGFESASIYFVNDGIKHVLLGARGTWKLDMQPNQIARFSFTLTGLLGTITDAANPAIDTTKFIKPVPVSKANTTFSLLGYAGACEAFSFDLAADIQPRLLINEESIEYTDRQMTGEATMATTSLATVDWFAKAQAHDIGVMAAQHGTVAGNIVQFDAARVQIGRTTYGETQKILNNKMPLMLLPTVGNDEFTITVK